MIGEIKLWCKYSYQDSWYIIKVFKNTDSIKVREFWLKTYLNDFPLNKYMLSTHNPDKSVGE